MDSTNATLRVTVRGFVQGVGFRVFVQSVAWRLDLRGYVRNLPDGAVGVVASGRRSTLEELLVAIRRGPVGAHVAKVETDWQEGEVRDLCKPFEVRH